jgi:hypothetical protein
MSDEKYNDDDLLDDIIRHISYSQRASPMRRVRRIATRRVPDDIIPIMGSYIPGDITLQNALDLNPLGNVVRGVPTGTSPMLEQYSQHQLMNELYYAIDGNHLSRAATLMLHFIHIGTIINPEVVELLINRIAIENNPQLLALLSAVQISGSQHPLDPLRHLLTPEQLDDLTELRPSPLGTGIAYNILMRARLLPGMRRRKSSRSISPSRRRKGGPSSKKGSRSRFGFRPRNTLGF